MKILEKITSDDLQKMGLMWAKTMIGEDWSDEKLKDLLYDSFINGFMAGAIQIRAIIEEFGNEKEAV